MKGTVSLCMIVRDELDALPSCLTAARPFVDEILVADTGSLDNTPRIAESFGAKVLEIPWTDDFSAARNRSLEAATSDWILVLDADEILKIDDPLGLRSDLADETKAGFVVPLRNLSDDGGFYESLVLRCYRNHPDVRYRGMLHERVDESLDVFARDRSLTIGTLSASIEHHGYLSSFVEARGKNSRNRRLLDKTMASSDGDPYLLYKCAVHPLNYLHRRETVISCLSAAWQILRSLDRDSCQRYLFAAEVPALLALELAKREDRKQAISLISQGLSHCGESPNLHFVAALTHQSLGNHREAITHFDQALTFEGKILACAPLEGAASYHSYNGKSESLMALGFDRKAGEMRSRALANKPPARDDLPHAFLSDVATLAAANDVARALRFVLARIDHDPQDATAWSRGHDLLRALGKSKAVATWERRARAALGHQ